MPRPGESGGALQLRAAGRRLGRWGRVWLWLLTLLTLKRRGEHGSWRLYGYPWLMNVDETLFSPVG